MVENTYTDEQGSQVTLLLVLVSLLVVVVN